VAPTVVWLTLWQLYTASSHFAYKITCLSRNWIDEVGFYLLPALVHVWAPVSEPPIVHVPCRYDHLLATSAITPSGQLLMQVQEEAYRGEDVVRFLDMYCGVSLGNC
jgi:hypothetical protein